VLSAGEDGFLAIWNTGSNGITGRFQLTPYAIDSMVLRPGVSQVALIENDPMGLCRVSVWDYLAKRNLFTLRFRDPVSYINYSAGGSFLIVSGGGRDGVVFIHPETGEILQSPQDLSGSAAFAATGRSEKTMVCYLTSGALSYWDLETGREIRRFNAPPNIREPVLIGSNRFLAGFENGGLIILDAVSGLVLSRGGNIGGEKIFPGDPDSTEFVCLGSSPATLYHLNINNQGRLETKNRKSLPSSISPVSCGLVIASDALVLGNTGGKLLVFRSSGNSRLMETGRPQEKILDAAVSSGDAAFITEKNRMAFIPLDYNCIGGRVKLEDSGGYVNIASDPGGDSSFLLWQPDNTRTFPMIKTYSGFPETGSASEAFLDRLSFRFPLRSVSILENKILLLDSMGNLRLINRDGGGVLFSYSAIGSQDASFVDGENIVVGRSAVSGNTPFLKINILTGETVPLSYPAAIGARVYRGSGGGVYGAAVIRDGPESRTAIIALHTADLAQARPLVEYAGEDTFFDMAETGGLLASNLGGGAAAVYRIAGSQSPALPLERSPGLPLRILNGGRWFILLDTEGNITWHDPATGKILALFRVYENEWILEKEGTFIRGRITR
jgi:hypothetical protein